MEYQNFKYYVYEHWLDSQCFYIGKSNTTTDRAHTLYDCLRNKYWAEFCMGRKQDIIIKIVKYFDFNKEAIKFEQEQAIRRKNEGHPVKCRRYGNKMSEGMIKEQMGELNPNYGNKWELEQREILRQKARENNKGAKNPRAKIVLVLDKSKNVIDRFETANPCAEKYNMKYGMVHHYIRTGRFCEKKQVYFCYEV